MRGVIRTFTGDREERDAQHRTAEDVAALRIRELRAREWKVSDDVTLAPLDGCDHAVTNSDCEHYT